LQITSISETDHADFLALVNAEIRPDRAKTNAWDDFPLILGLENREWCLGAYTPDGKLAAGIACLIRELKTSCGIFQFAGIGSVVTEPAFRGQGLSSALQIEMLSRLRRKNVPLAVLWTDKPEIYAGRGFTSAGYEFHVDFKGAAISSELPDGFSIGQLQSSHIDGVEQLFLQHAYHGIRLPGDSRQLYLMPGTQGHVVLNETQKVVAYIFCEKGGDFPSYVHEWGGSPEFILPLLHKVRALGQANQVLVPAGALELAEVLIRAGAAWSATPSGYWAVLDSHVLRQVLENSGVSLSPGPISDPVQLLGSIDEEGSPHPGILELAVWGFDSV
jgi:GNAT superfamily N-acetyltransferase